MRKRLLRRLKVSRDAGPKVIHLYLLVKTLPLDRFISLFVRLFFRGTYNFEDVFLPQCQLRRPTIQMSIKILRVWEAIPSLVYNK